MLTSLFDKIIMSFKLSLIIQKSTDFKGAFDSVSHAIGKQINSALTLSPHYLPMNKVFKFEWGWQIGCVSQYLRS